MQTQTRRILYVDEENENSFILETLLRDANCEPVTASFASDALQFAQGERFDLFVLSKRFPISSGVYLCHKLHEIAPQTPILFLSDDLADTVSSGSQEYVIDSADAHEIVENVQRLLSQHPMAAAAVL